MIKILQAGRFFAAFAVVLHHTILGLDAFYESVPNHVQFLHYGYLGVDFFFVLSGFIIHFTFNKNIDLVTYYIARIKRIFVPYLPIGIILAVAYIMLPSLSASNREWGLITTLTLFPTIHPSALSVAWTLQHELFFYILYGFLASFGFLRVGLFIWLGLISYATLTNQIDTPLLNLVLSSINVEFVFGIIAAHWYIKNKKRYFTIPLFLSCLCIYAFSLYGFHRSYSPFIGLAIAVLLPTLCSLEYQRIIIIPKFFIFGGAASYAIYLVHNPIISAIIRMAIYFEAQWYTTLVIVPIFCCMFGGVYHFLWEKPLLKLFKSKMQS